MEDIRHICCTDNCDIAVRYVRARAGHDRLPVVLTHGTYSNAGICQGLAGYLAGRGHPCWIMEWRGHGSSGNPGKETDFEDTALGDVPAVIRHVREQSGAGGPLIWIGHSGGGLVLPMYLARHPGEQRHFAGIVTLASQASGACASLVNRCKAGLALALVSLLGYAPGSAVGLGPEDESRKMMHQWIGWNLKQAFAGNDGFRYDRALKEIRLPLLSIAADQDTFIAPPLGCQKFFNMFGGHEQSRFTVFSEPAGSKKAFDHTRIMLSRSAETRVWPFIAEWIEGIGTGLAAG